MTIRYETEAKIKMRKEKLNKIVSAQKPALMLGGLMGTDMRITKAAYEGGCRIFEPNHPAMALQMGLCGVTNMKQAEEIRHLVPLERMITAVKGIRSITSEEVFITCGARGTFTEKEPVPFTLEDALKLAYAGADCLHTHKSNIEDVAEIADIAHKAGLLCEAYISDYDTFGVQASTDEMLVKTIHDYEAAGVDMIGLCTGMTYQGQSAKGFSQEFINRMELFIKETSVIKILEGGIKQGNIETVKEMGFDILVISTAIDDVIKNATTDAVLELLK